VGGSIASRESIDKEEITINQHRGASLLFPGGAERRKPQMDWLDQEKINIHSWHEPI
jgi:hypothetical protein